MAHYPLCSLEVRTPVHGLPGTPPGAVRFQIPVVALDGDVDVITKPPEELPWHLTVVNVLPKKPALAVRAEIFWVDILVDS